MSDVPVTKKQPHRGGSGGGVIHIPSSNWRDDCVGGGPPHRQTTTSDHRPGRFLFDPKNPDRPIGVPGNPPSGVRMPFSNSSGGGDHPARFPMDARFAHPGNVSSHQPRSLVLPHHHQGSPGASYKPPFPNR